MGADDHMHLWRQVLEQKGEGIVNRSGINDVVVVEDEDETSSGIVEALAGFLSSQLATASAPGAMKTLWRLTPTGCQATVYLPNNVSTSACREMPKMLRYVAENALSVPTRSEP